jgi:hypothetical protein
MMSIDKINNSTNVAQSAFLKPKDDKKSLLQSEAETAIPKSAMISPNEPGKGTKVDRMA